MSNTELALNPAANLRAYYELTKPKVVALILFTALVGMLLVPGTTAFGTALAALLGIGLAAAAGAVFNHVLDRRIDALMERTRARPFPTGRVDLLAALVFGSALALVSALLLLVFTNTLAATLTLASLIGYALIYTGLLKRATPQNIVWGGAAGAAPPLLGWVALTGELTVEPLILFLIIFAWTPPHFWALAIRRREEYARAGLPMLPVTHGLAFTRHQILGYTVMLLAVSLLPFAVRMSGWLYLAAAVPLGLVFIVKALRFCLSGDERAAMPMFRYSIVYLTALFAALLVDHYAI